MTENKDWESAFMKYDYLIVGAGLFGSVFAREKKDAGKSVLVIDRRDTVAGNLYTEKLEGINVHRYGAHIFHTSKEEVKHVAHLARLAITEAEAEKFAEQLGKITDFAEQLNELDTTNVEPTTHVLPLVNVMREDVAGKGLDREKMMLNVKEQENGQVKVPSILD